MKNTLLLFLALFTGSVFAQKPIVPLKPQIDRIVKKLMDTAEVTGLQLSIIQNGKPWYIKSYGYKNYVSKELNDTSTIFYAASLAKPLFAYLVMQLVDKKVIDLDKPLYTYLPKPIPEYKAYTDLAGDERWKLITARHCLSHSTGFPNWRELNPRENKKLQLFFTPGERYAYSGEGLMLLQLVVETITGRSLEALAAENIFVPFGMKNTSFLWQPSFEKNYALGHDMNEDTLSKRKFTTAGAAGSMETTIADYTRFTAAVMQGKRVSAPSLEQMFSPQVVIRSKKQFPSLDTGTTQENESISLAYGLGWGLFVTPLGNAFFKEGHGDGWVHYMISIPSKKMAVIIMTNSANGESIFPELVKELTGVVIPAKWEGYIPYRPTIKLPVEVLQEFTGEYSGKLKAKIQLVNGRLKVSSETVGLPPTNIYAIDTTHFFLKVMDIEMVFYRDASGKVFKVFLNDEGEKYELLKVR